MNRSKIPSEHTEKWMENTGFNGEGRHVQLTEEQGVWQFALKSGCISSLNKIIKTAIALQELSLQ